MDGRIEVGNEGQKTYVGLIGCYNSILGNGIAKMLEDIPNFFIMGVFSSSDSLIGLFESNPPDFCLVDSFFLRRMTEKIHRSQFVHCKTLLIENAPLTPNELHSLIMTTGISGILYKNSDKKTLRKAIFSVLSGELWFKRETYQELMEKTKTIVKSRENLTNLLTPTEIRVVRFVCQGLKNRDVAEKLYVSENTVKTHLYNIYKKLNIRSRAELMKHYLSQV